MHGLHEALRGSLTWGVVRGVDTRQGLSEGVTPPEGLSEAAVDTLLVCMQPLPAPLLSTSCGHETPARPLSDLAGGSVTWACGLLVSGVQGDRHCFGWHQGYLLTVQVCRAVLSVCHALMGCAGPPKCEAVVVVGKHLRRFAGSMSSCFNSL
jgi:hypothetical protein